MLEAERSRSKKDQALLSALALSKTSKCKTNAGPASLRGNEEKQGQTETAVAKQGQAETAVAVPNQVVVRLTETT